NFCRGEWFVGNKTYKEKEYCRGGRIAGSKIRKRGYCCRGRNWPAKENETVRNFAEAGGFSAIKRIKRRNTSVADDLPAAKSEKENIVAVEESWKAKEKEIEKSIA